MARCQLRLGRLEASADSARQLLAQPLDAQHGLMQYGGLLLARALRRLAQGQHSRVILAQWVKTFPQNPQLKLQLAEQVVRSSGDWHLVRRIMATLGDQPSVQRDLSLLRLRSFIYDGGCAAPALAQSIGAFSDAYPVIGASSREQESSGLNVSRRPRVGLISPLFSASPVYFMCIGALRELAKSADLVFFTRDAQQDWATREFQAVASDWHDVSAASATQLARTLRLANLDAIFDLAGWNDVSVLQALNHKPVRQQYKWVGGQIATTGLRCFDGFISDEHQSPANHAHLYSEPLRCLPGGYVTYTPPAYMPEPAAPAEGPLSVGVMAHPAKVSVAFLRFLRQEMDRVEAAGLPPMVLRFIGARYGQPGVIRRIAQQLGLDEQHRRGPVSVQFVATRGHAAQLQAIAALHWVVDTFPFTSGLTALEALALGVPLRTYAGAHFSARHGYSHARFAGLTAQQIDLQALGAFDPVGLHNQGKSLLPADSARRDHQRLASSLVQLLSIPHAH